MWNAVTDSWHRDTAYHEAHYLCKRNKMNSIHSCYYVWKNPFWSFAFFVSLSTPTTKNVWRCPFLAHKNELNKLHLVWICLKVGPASRALGRSLFLGTDHTHRRKCLALSIPSSEKCAQQIAPSLVLPHIGALLAGLSVGHYFSVQTTPTTENVWRCPFLAQKNVLNKLHLV